MQIKIKNHLLEQSIGLLFNLELKGKQSRHRTKFIKRLNAQLAEVKEGHEQLLTEHSNKDEEGNPVIIDNKYDIKDMEAFNKDYKELYDEELIIDSPVDDEMLRTVKDILLKCEVSFSGQQASIYDEICDIFELAESSMKGGE